MIPEFLKKLNPFPQTPSTREQSIISDLGKTDKVDTILREFNAYYNFESENLERSSESWNLYKGYGGSSYPLEVKNKMKEQNRNPFEGNIIRQKVDGLAGSIIKNYFDIGFEPVNGELSPLTKVAKELLLIDKELLDWDTAYRQLVVDGLVYNGIEEIYIDYRYSPFGNIGFRNILPNHMLFDPRWVSNNTWDLKNAMRVAYLTADQIKEVYETKSEEIDNAIAMRKQQAGNFDNGDKERGYQHYGFDTTYGDKYRVIEHHYMKKEKQNIEIIGATGEQVPQGTDEYKKQWAILNNVDMSMGVIERKESIDTYYVCTVVPGLSHSLILEERPGLIQIGRLPFFPWSSARINGANSGIPDLLKSIQQTYNFRESLLDYSIATSAVGGVMIDPDVVDGDEGKMAKVEREWNKPGFRMWTAPGAISSGREFFKDLPRTPMDYGVVNEISRMITMADMVSKQPAALDGRSEGSEETGILYARKQMQAEITQTLIFKSLEQHWNDKGEAWILTAKKLYSGVYREFYSIGEQKKIELNAPIVSPSGEVVINDFSQLPRSKVVIAQSPAGTTMRAVDRAINTELLRVIGPENPLTRAQAVKNVMKTLDGTKADKAKYEEASEIEYQFAKENLITQTLGLKAQQMQFMQQMQPPAPQQTAPEGQGVPPTEEGVEVPPPAEGQAGGQPQAAQAPGNPQQEMQGSNVAAATPPQ